MKHNIYNLLHACSAITLSEMAPRCLRWTGTNADVIYDARSHADVTYIVRSLQSMNSLTIDQPSWVLTCLWLFVCSALLMLFSALVLLALPAIAQQSMATDEKNSVWKAKKEEHREEHEWPEDIVLTGERTGLGSAGCV